MQKILVVDDDLTTIELIRRVFTDMDYEMLSATSGEEAINVAIKYTPDLILLDISMPGMDGFEVMKSLRGKSIQSSVIFLTASDNKDHIELAFKLGAEDYIKKPFAFKELIQRVKTRMELRATKEKLLKSEEQFRSFVENTMDITFTVTMEGILTYVSPNWEYLLGHDLSEVVGQPFAKFVPNEEDVERCFDFLNKVLQKDPSAETVEYRVRHKNGDLIWHEANGSSYEKDGSVIFIGVARDITKRKQAEDDLKYQLEFEKMVSDIANTFAKLSAQEIDKGINYALELSCKFFNVDRGYVFCFSADGTAMSNTHEWCADGIEPQIESIQDLPLSSLPWMREQYIIKDYIYIPDISFIPIEAKEDRAEIQRQGIKSLLNVPLLNENNVIGFFGFDSVKEEKVWTEGQAIFLKLLAGILVNALDKKLSGEKIRNYTLELEELYHQLDREINRAKEIYERTLPRKVPSINEFDFSAYYKPAQILGGDFYNIIKENDKIIFYISDVTGHGLEASLLSSFMKEAIESYIVLKNDDIQPDKILKHLYAQFLRENYPDEYFICIFLAVIDTNSREMTFCNAGIHEAPLMNKTHLTCPGLPIATTIPEKLYNFTNYTILLNEGDTIFFTTDGLTEQSMGEDRFVEILTDTFYNNNYFPPNIIKRIINRKFLEFNKSFQGDDDITYIVMRISQGKRKMSFMLNSSFEELDRLKNQLNDEIGESFEFYSLVLHEIVANAIEHGNKFNENKKIKVEIELDDKYIVFTVEDQGEGFEWTNKINKEIDLEGFKDRGRGIPMCEVFVEHLLYNEKGNSCSIVMKK